jgi:UbiD family decarboxylase
MIGRLAAAEIRQLVQDNGLLVKEAFTPYESQATWAEIQDRKALRAIKEIPPISATRLATFFFSHKYGMQIHRLFVVGDDIDPFNFKDVILAHASSCRPTIDEFRFEDVDSYPLVPYMSHGPGTKLTGRKVIGNCLLPQQYEMEQNWVTCDFDNGYLEDVKKKVLSRWEKFGLEL